MVAPLFRRKGKPAHKFPPQLSTDLPTGQLGVQLTNCSAPQNADLSIEGWSRAPSLLAQGILGAVILLAPQFDPSLQLQAKVFPSARTAPVTGSFVRAPQQQYVDSTARISPAAIAGSKPASSQNAFGAPQLVDLTLQGFVQSSAKTPPVVSSAAKAVFGSQENIDLGIEGWSRAPSLLNQGIVPPFTRTDPQPDPTQTAKVFAASVPPPAVSGRLSAFLSAAPEQIDLGIEAWHRHPAERNFVVPTTGPVPQSVLVPPQADTTQIAASIWAPASTTQGSSASVEYRFGAHAIALVDAEALKNAIWPSLRSPPAVVTGAVPQIVIGAPQADTSQFSVIQPSVKAAPIGTGAKAPIFFAQPQNDPTQTDAKVWSSVRTFTAITIGPVTSMVWAPPQTPSILAATVWASPAGAQGSSNSAEYRFGGHALALYAAEGAKSRLLQTMPPTPPTLGVTIRPVPPVPPQFDTTINPTQVWTNSTFSPGIPPAPPGETIYPIAMFPIGMGWR